ncbi:MAG TPA: enoyl-CoA hydratase-related protein [Chitinophagaceae bacterium]|nr:enoyl-CoA hydratase-related protein [Chitinophagaceae bacterium]
MIRMETDRQLAIITLDRPEKRNAFNRKMALLLQSKLDECAANDQIRCVCITGAGKGFCAGQDLEEITGPQSPGFNRILSEHYNPIVTKIRDLKKPVLAAVNGAAAGAGANIALCCDIVIAAQSAFFVQSFSNIGLIPDSGGSFFLPRLIGWQKASALMMLGEKINAAEAERLGMIYRYYEDEVFMKEALELGQRLASMPTLALSYIKKALQWSSTHSLYEQLMNEDKLQQRAALSNDFKEGVAAFLEKREPLFKGN